LLKIVYSLRSLILSMVLGVVLTGCGSVAAGDGDSSGAVEGSVSGIESTVDVGDRNDEDPIPMTSAPDLNVVSRDSTPDGSTQLPFAATFPVSAGNPLVVFVTDPKIYDPSELAVVDAEYDSASPYGPFRLREERTPDGILGTTFLQDLSHFCDGQSCTSYVVSITPGVPGVLLAQDGAPTSITWVASFGHDNYKLVVMGPGDTFTRDSAVALASEIAKQFSPLAGASASG
jgi:hypothetical protein